VTVFGTVRAKGSIDQLYLPVKRKRKKVKHSDKTLSIDLKLTVGKHKIYVYRDTTYCLIEETVVNEKLWGELVIFGFCFSCLDV